MMINLPDSQLLLNDPYYLAVEKRLLRISLCFGAVILLGALLLGSLIFAYSFVLGALVSVVNFVWMKQGIDQLLSGFSAQPATPVPSRKGIIFKYFIRYALIGGILYAIFRFRFFDAKAAILGLFVVVMAVLAECVYQISKSIIEDWKRGRT
jgi:hypothetical protein